MVSPSFSINYKQYKNNYIRLCNSISEQNISPFGAISPLGFKQQESK